MVFIFALPISLIFAPAALAHSGYHFNGAITDSQAYGVRADIEVSNPHVPSGPIGGPADHYVARILARDGSGGCGGIHWLEAGWGEVGWDRGPDNFNRRAVFTYDTILCDWLFYDDQYPVVTGQTITVMLAPHSSCTSSSTSCSWRASIYWNGVWQLLRAVVLPFNNTAQMQEYGEAQNATSGTHWDVASGGAEGLYQDWFDGQLRFSSGVWGTWTPSVPTTKVNLSPYFVAWLANYYRWYVYYSP